MRIALPARQLRALGRRRGRWQVEPGTFRLTAGPSSAEQGLITELAVDAAGRMVLPDGG